GEVEDRSGVRHVVRYGAILCAHQRGVLPARCFLAVAELALLLVDGLALSRRSAALRQADAIRPDADVPERKVGLGDRLAEVRGFGGRARGEYERGGDNKQAATHRHVSPRPCCRPTSW